MNNDNLNVSHLAWCGLIALHTARRDGIVTSPAQDNLFLTRWLATAEKQRRFPRALASDISWLLKEGREKGLRDPDLRATESTQLAGLAAGLEARVRAALGPHADDLLVRLVLQVYGACLTSALEVWLGTAEAPLPADLVALHRRARRQLSTLLVEPRPPTSLSAIDPMNAQVAGL